MEETMNNVVEETINNQVMDTVLTDVCVPNEVSVIPTDTKDGISVMKTTAIVGGVAAIAYGGYKLVKWGKKKLKKKFGKKYAKPDSDENIVDSEAAEVFEDDSVDEESEK